MQNEEDDPIAAAEWGAENLKAAIEAIPTELLEREDRIVQKQRLQNASAISKTRDLQKLADEIVTAISSFTPCREGCSACCHYPVSVTLADVRIIESNTVHRRLRAPLPGSNFMGMPCPFLIESRCSIYEFRPLVCRTHLAFTKSAKWCAPKTASRLEMPMIAFDGLREARSKISREPPLDIRQVFGRPSPMP